MIYSSHSCYELIFHFVFVTKHRRRFPVFAMPEAVQIIQDGIKYAAPEGKKLSGNIGKQNHLHLCIELPGSIAPSAFAGRFKAYTSKELNRLSTRMTLQDIEARHWPGWQTGFYVGSVAATGNIDEIINYIEKQEKE